MGSHTLTRIYSPQKDDYIDIHDGHSDGDLEIVKKDLKSQVNFWEHFVENLQADVINSEYDFLNLVQWSDDFENFLHVNKNFPCIEATAAMMSMRSFDNHHILPYYNKSSKQLLDFWGYNNPNISATLKNPTVSFMKKALELELEPKKVDSKEYKIIRIQTFGNGEANEKVFVDIKVRNFNRKKFLLQVLTLPEFWRNFHFVSRKKKNATIHPAYKLNKTLTNFYTPSKNFSIQTGVGRNKKEIFDNVRSKTPLNLYVNSFAMHLFFSMPGLALPLTAREQLWSGKSEPEMTITLNDQEINLITIAYGQDNKENRRILQEFSEGFSEREQSFAKFFELSKYSGGNFLLTTSEEFAFCYETNMIELFDSLTKIDAHTA